MIVAVTGLAREARLIAGPNLTPVIGGGDAALLKVRLETALAQGARGIISIGICGALSPALRVGDTIIASKVIAGDEIYPTHAAWALELRRHLPKALAAPLAGVDLLCADTKAKKQLRAKTKAAGADMESHVAARAANAHGLPFAALRVVSDASHRSLPPAAHLALRPDGKIDMPAVWRSVLRAPLQLPALLRTAVEAEIAFAVLFRCRHVLGAGFGAADVGDLVFDVP